MKGQSFKNEISQTIPGQAMDLVELVRRFTQGQRLVINNRPLNVFECDEQGNFYDKTIKDETFDNVLPDIDDRVDIEEYLESLSSDKSVIRTKIKELKDKKAAVSQDNTAVAEPAD